ncbi:MAG: type II secretion system F family protein [Phycisphaerales bacterium]|jgi:general secretion pathway protein F|nr:type II secretion system F family protein [Phycisphaerales bacterium]MBT7170409.1 type II secretion system F family protein [Phycisphaerales bacterium]
MANYQYIAKNSAGESVDGEITAETEALALRMLSDGGLFVVSIAEASAASDLLGRGGKKIRPRDVGATLSKLADLLRAGVPILQGLDVLIKTTRNETLLAVLTDIRERVSQGTSFHESLAAHPSVFPPLYRSMVHAGEEADFLADVLEQLAGFIERQDELRNRVVGMMVYPMVLVTIGVVGLAAILVFLVPKFRDAFEAGDSELPWITQMLFGASDALLNHFPLVGAFLALLVFGVITFVKSEFGRGCWQRWRLHMWIVGPLNRAVALARFCRILGTMLNNGVALLDALEIAAGATGSTILAEQVRIAAEEVQQGHSLAKPLGEASEIFPPDVVEMVAVAEESNQLPSVLLKAADTVERDTNRQVDIALRLVEPLILVVIAAAVGFAAVALLMPILLMASNMA